MKKTFKPGPIQRRWIEELRNHPERQHRGELGFRDETGWHCCVLGQGLLAVHPNLFSECEADKPLTDGEGDSGSRIFLLKSFSDLGLRSRSGDFTKTYKRKYRTLMGMNDHKTKPLTFPEIADFMEKHPEVVFEKSV